jgi:hypothetical protein
MTYLVVVCGGGPEFWFGQKRALNARLKLYARMSDPVAIFEKARGDAPPPPKYNVNTARLCCCLPALDGRQILCKLANDLVHFCVPHNGVLRRRNAMWSQEECALRNDLFHRALHSQCLSVQLNHLFNMVCKRSPLRHKSEFYTHVTTATLTLMGRAICRSWHSTFETVKSVPIVTIMPHSCLIWVAHLGGTARRFRRV